MSQKQLDHQNNYKTPTNKNIEGSSSNEIFDNIMVNNALASLSVQDKKRYQQMGEEMYSSVDFSDSTILNNLPPPVVESLKDIEQQIKDGLHPSDMDKDQKNLLKEIYGDEWYTKWGFTKEDLDEIK